MHINHTPDISSYFDVLIKASTPPALLLQLLYLIVVPLLGYYIVLIRR